MNTYLGNVFDLNEHLINLGLWNRDFGDREPVGLRYGRQPLITNERQMIIVSVVPPNY